MHCFILLLLLLLLLASSSTSAFIASKQRILSRQKRIIGDIKGVNATEKASLFPQLVTLHGYVDAEPPTQLHRYLPILHHPYAHCSANILDEYHVVTAAHCLFDYKGQPLITSAWKIYLSGSRRKPKVKTRFQIWFKRKIALFQGKSPDVSQPLVAHIKHAYVHNGFRADTLDHDIAILRTTRMHFTPNNKPLSLNLTLEATMAGFPRPGSKCHFAGWGNTDRVRGTTEKLRMAEMSVVELKRCSSVYWKRRDWRGSLCVFSNKSSMSYGDSGGGLICRNKNGEPYLAGIASSSAKEITMGRQYRPMNFMDVSFYYYWIKHIMTL